MRCIKNVYIFLTWAPRMIEVSTWVVFWLLMNNTDHGHEDQELDRYHQKTSLLLTDFKHKQGSLTGSESIFSFQNLRGIGFRTIVTYSKGTSRDWREIWEDTMTGLQPSEGWGGKPRASQGGLPGESAVIFARPIDLIRYMITAVTLVQCKWGKKGRAESAWHYCHCPYFLPPRNCYCHRNKPRTPSVKIQNLKCSKVLKSLSANVMSLVENSTS